MLKIKHKETILKPARDYKNTTHSLLLNIHNSEHYGCIYLKCGRRIKCQFKIIYAKKIFFKGKGERRNNGKTQILRKSFVTRTLSKNISKGAFFPD